MDEQLTKSLSDLIDETLNELEELRKSKMSAAEIKLEGPGEGIAGKPSDGQLDAKKAEDEDDEDEDDEDEDDEDDEDKAEKAEDEGREEDDPADKPSAKRKLKDIMQGSDSITDEDAEKSEDEDEDEEVEKSSKMAKKEDKKEPHKDDKKHEEKEKKLAQKLLNMHKSEEDTSTLIKSYVDERIQPIEEKLSTIFQLISAMADQPVAPRGVTAKTAPLLKSNDASYGEVLSKSDLANKLFELKKSGTHVDSLDIAKVEMGQDLVNIVKKYEIS